MKRNVTKKIVALSATVALGMSTTACTEQEKMAAAIAGLMFFGGATAAGVAAIGSSEGGSSNIGSSNNNDALTEGNAEIPSPNDDAEPLPVQPGSNEEPGSVKPPAQPGFWAPSQPGSWTPAQPVEDEKTSDPESDEDDYEVIIKPPSGSDFLKDLLEKNKTDFAPAPEEAPAPEATEAPAAESPAPSTTTEPVAEETPAPSATKVTSTATSTVTSEVEVVEPVESEVVVTPEPSTTVVTPAPVTSTLTYTTTPTIPSQPASDEGTSESVEPTAEPTPVVSTTVVTPEPTTTVVTPAPVTTTTTTYNTTTTTTTVVAETEIVKDPIIVEDQGSVVIKDTEPAPAPVEETEAPAPVEETTAPTPVEETTAPAPSTTTTETPAPAPEEEAPVLSPEQAKLQSLIERAEHLDQAAPTTHQITRLRSYLDYAKGILDGGYTGPYIKDAYESLNDAIDGASYLETDNGSSYRATPKANKLFKRLSDSDKVRYSEAILKSYTPSNTNAPSVKEVVGWGTPEFAAAQARAKQIEDEAYRQAKNGTIRSYQPIATAEDVRVLAPFVTLSDHVTATSLPRYKNINNKLSGNKIQITPLDQEGKTNHVIHSIVQHGLFRAKQDGYAKDASPHHRGKTSATAYQGKQAPRENMINYGAMPDNMTAEEMGSAAEVAYLSEYRDLGTNRQTGHLYNMMDNNFFYTSVYCAEADSQWEDSLRYTITTTYVNDNFVKFHKWASKVK